MTSLPTNPLILLVACSLLLAGCAAGLTTKKKMQLQAELAQMAEVDQVAAYIPQGKYQNYISQRWASFQDSVFKQPPTRCRLV